jgi:F-type H+-transporting ATPase subunit epsilon
MKLQILTPEKLFFSGEVVSVTLPGTMGSFTLLENHASLIASLQKGIMSYKAENGPVDLNIGSGFVEVNKNSVVICVENIEK